MDDKSQQQTWCETQALDRFLRYVKISTASDHESSAKPSTPGQWDLLHLLETELQALGLSTELLDTGYLLGRLPPSPGASADPVAFCAHVDTSPDAPGEGVVPLVHRPYKGGPLALPGGVVLDPSLSPELELYKDQDLVTSDGRTLLGADDKAGLAEIMTALAWWQAHPEALHPAVEVIFTTDEEIGQGVAQFPWEKIRSKKAYTLDGGLEGSLEIECYNAVMVKARFEGRSWHPGAARGRLVNAAGMAAQWVSLLPRSESPEATDGRYGNAWVNQISGGIESAEATVYVRDFDQAQLDRRLSLLEANARAVELAYPGGRITLAQTVQYRNMKTVLDQHPEVTAKAVEAYRRVGLEPRFEAIRGGTDGARLTEQGLPTPNLFAGGLDFHSRTEWIAVRALGRAARVVVELGALWA